MEPIGDLTNVPTFSDRKVEHGKTYKYAISAIDKKNNESEKSPPLTSRSEMSFRRLRHPVQSKAFSASTRARRTTTVSARVSDEHA